MVGERTGVTAIVAIGVTTETGTAIIGVAAGTTTVATIIDIIVA